MIRYPYLPDGRRILYTSATDPFIQIARQAALMYSLDETHKVGAIIVRDRVLIGVGANGSDHHRKHDCERKRQGIPTSQGYEHCEGCHPVNHAEQKAIRCAQTHKHDTRGAVMYLWGHWWACKSCWDAIIASGIENLHLLEKSEILFNREAEGNIIGRQFKSR